MEVGLEGVERKGQPEGADVGWPNLLETCRHEVMKV